jgi:ankyrin repeat protein
MSPANRRPLPARANLEQQKKLAKELLASFHAGDDGARARVRAELPDKPRIVLADAQFVLAREYGFENWNALREHLETRALEALSPVEQLKRAIERRDAPATRRTLQRHAAARAAIDEPLFDFGATALNSAAESGNLELVNTVLEFGADPNRKSDWWAGGFHPLHVAKPSVAERLLAAGSIPDACAASRLNRLDVLTQLLTEDPARVHERGGDGQTPLHFARSREIANLLIEAGADLDARDLDHRSTPAQWMLGDERTDVARYLVERGATADIFLAAALGLADRAREIALADPSSLSLRTGQGDYRDIPPSSYHIYLWTIGPSFTPLQTAAKFGQQHVVDAVRELAPLAQQLLFACHQGDGDTARAIVRAHPNLVASLTGADRRALTDEAWTANAAAVELMVELGFDPSVPSVTGAAGGNALHCAAWEGSPECVAAILRYPAGRALIAVKDSSYGGTPLSWCCHGSQHCHRAAADYAAVARLLIAAGGTFDADWECSDAMQAVLASASA